MDFPIDIIESIPGAIKTVTKSADYINLTSNHVLIIDNAMLHKTLQTRALVEQIEHDFANIKRKREYHSESTLEDIIREYENV